jgi:hypothetical protein
MAATDGSIFPIIDHLLFGAEAEASIVSDGMEFSAAPVLGAAAMVWRWVVPDGDGRRPSKPKKRLEDGE